MSLKPSMVMPHGPRAYEVRVDEGKRIQPHQITETEAFMDREFTTDIKRNFEYIADNNLHHRYVEEKINDPWAGSGAVNSFGGVCREIGASSLFGDSNSTNYMFQKFNREQLPINNTQGGRYVPDVKVANIDSYPQHTGGGLASQIASTIAQLAGGVGAAPSAALGQAGPRIPGAPAMRQAASPDSMRQNKQGLFVPGAQFQQAAAAQRSAPAQDEQAVIDQIRRNREAIMKKMNPAQKVASKPISENDYEEI